MAPSSIGIEEIDRKYEVLAKMGEGGMGEIYQVRHLLLDEVRVIKTIRAQFRGDAELQARFLREARVATQLRHPNIVTIHDFSVGEDGTAAIVMEFVSGASLAECMRSGEPPTQAEILDIARQTLDALGYLHQRQIVHRDVSPDNVMIGRDADGRPHVKLIDLGIAKPLEGADWQTRTDLFVGKVRYASPEQLGGAGGEGGLDGRSDLYSFAVMLYELLTGTLPITGSDQASLIAGHLFHPPRSFAETDPQGRVPPALRQVLERALAKRPEERFASAEEMARALDGAAGAARVSAAGGGAPTLLAPAGSVEAPTVRAPAPATPAPLPSAETPRRWWNPWLALVPLLLALAWAGAWLLQQRGGGERGDEDPLAALAGLDFGAYHALIVGNDDYQHLPRLETAERDAREVARLLEERYGFRVDLLVDADRHELITALAKLAAAAGPRDNLLVYYAGHGWLDRGNDSGYWQPVDADPLDTTNWISAKFEVTDILDRSVARRVLVIADSCYVGTADGAPPGTPLPADAEALRARLEELLPQHSRLSLTSGGQSPVLDSGGDGRHSIFARALLDALGGNEGLLDATALADRLRPAVEAAAHRLGVTQAPQLAPLPRSRDEGGGFYFVPRLAPAAQAS